MKAIFGFSALLFFFVFTGAAGTKDLHGVSGGGKFVFFCELFLEFFNFGADYLDEPVAFEAD